MISLSPVDTSAAGLSPDEKAAIFTPPAKIRITGNMLIVSGTGVPSHPYGPFPACVDSNMDGRFDNPNQVLSKRYAFQIPLHPRPARARNTRHMPPVIGVAVNGVPLFSASSAEGTWAVASEVFDTCNGHPDRMGRYHYHQYSPCLVTTSNTGHAGIMGIIADGYLIFGPIQNSRGAGNKLDACNGHEDPKRGYHYHATTDPAKPLIGCFAGIPERANFFQGEDGRRSRQGCGIPSGGRNGGARKPPDGSGRPARRLPPPR